MKKLQNCVNDIFDNFEFDSKYNVYNIYKIKTSVITLIINSIYNPMAIITHRNIFILNKTQINRINFYNSNWIHIPFKLLKYNIYSNAERNVWNIL